MVIKKTSNVDMDDLLYALHYAAKNSEQGINGIAKSTGQREQTFRNKLTPGDVSHQLSLGDFVMVLNQTADTSPLDVLCRMFDGQFVSRTGQRSESITLAVLKAMSEHGDIATELTAALEDGVISDTELTRIHREIIEARNALIQLENTVNKNRNNL